MVEIAPSDSLGGNIDFSQIDIQKIRADVSNYDLGFFVLRNLLSVQNIEKYILECKRFIKTSSICFTRINTDWINDYVHPRSHDQIERTHRIYQYFHNHRSESTDSLLKDLLAFRNKVELPWHNNFDYKNEIGKLQDYIIVTHYTPNAGMLPRHQDYLGNLPHPLLQFQILLSKPGVDFSGGEFILYTKSGKRLKTTEELELKQGDALLFDKSLFHEVEPTLDTKGDGRWSVLIGARAKRHSLLNACLRRVTFSPLFYPITRHLKIIRQA